MRSLPLVVMLLAAAPLAAAQAYRWVDKDGVVHFSDKPAEGAEKIPLTAAPKPGSVPQTYLPSAPQGTSTAEVRYAACAVTSPAPEQTFQHADPISIVVAPQPALQRGDRVIVLLNGAPIREWPDGATSIQLPPQPRGAYTLSATVSGPDGAVKCRSATVSFTVFQPTVLSPGRKPAPR